MIAAGRVLGDVEFGKFMFALMLGGIFETLMDFGLHQVTVRAVARDKSARRSCCSTCSRSSCCGRPARSRLLIVTANLLDPHHDVRVACYLIGGSLVFRSYMLTIRGVLQGLEHFGWDLAVAIADRGLLLAFGLWALWSGSGPSRPDAWRSSSRAVSPLALGGRVDSRSARRPRRPLRSRPSGTIFTRPALPLGFFLIVLICIRTWIR